MNELTEEQKFIFKRFNELNDPEKDLENKRGILANLEKQRNELIKQAFLVNPNDPIGQLKKWNEASRIKGEKNENTTNIFKA